MKEASPGIREIMEKKVVAVKEYDPVREVLKLFRKYRFHMYPVMRENGQLAGTIDQDIILEILLFHRIPRVKHTHLTAVRSLGVNAGSVMVPHPVTISPDADLNDAADLMLKHNLNRICVVERGILVGIISKLDIISEIIKRKKLD